MKSKNLIKIFFFLALVVSALVAFRFSPLKEIITSENLKKIVASSGNWGPIVFILIYAGGICFFMPATLFTGIGAVLFGPLWGFVYNICGAMIGASLAFFIGRYLGRDLAASLVGNRLKNYDEKIAANGFATTLYLRLIFFPFTPLNFGMGITSVNFINYFWGTFFGIIAGGFAMTFFFATLADVWANHDWYQLLNLKTVFAIGLFVSSFFIPKLAKKFRLIQE